MIGLVLQETSVQVKYWNHATLIKKQVKNVLLIKLDRSLDITLSIENYCWSSAQAISVKNYEIRFSRSDYTHILEYLCRVFSLTYIITLFAVSVPVSLLLHASSIPMLNGINFSNWKERVQFHLNVLDLDIALGSKKPFALTDTSSAEEKYLYKAWEKSNRRSIIFMRMAIANNIKTTIPKTDSAKEFLSNVEDCFKIADKSLARTLMVKLTTMKFDGKHGIQEHAIEMTNLVAQLKTLGMNVDEFFLILFIFWIPYLFNMGNFKLITTLWKISGM